MFCTMADRGGETERKRDVNMVVVIIQQQCIINDIVIIITCDTAMTYVRTFGCAMYRIAARHFVSPLSWARLHGGAALVFARATRAADALWKASHMAWCKHLVGVA